MSEISILNGYKIKDKKAVRYYDTISNMKSDTTLKAGMYVKTKGYYSVNDGGNGEYIIRNKTNEDIEDNGRIHFIGDLVAELIIKDEVNVKQFGAKGDNISDDTTAINQAIASGKTVYIPNGTYNVSEVISLPNNTTIIGESKENTIITKSTETTPNTVFNFTGNGKVIIRNINIECNETVDYGILSNVTISMFELSNIKINQPVTAGIYTDRSTYLGTINNVTVTNTEGYGFYLVPIDKNSYTNTSINLKNCYCSECHNAYRIDGSYMNMENCACDGAYHIAYDLRGYIGSLISCGSESYYCDYMFYGDHFTNVTVVNAQTFATYDKADSVHIYTGHSSTWVFIGGKLAIPYRNQSSIGLGKFLEQSDDSHIKFIGTEIRGTFSKPSTIIEGCEISDYKGTVNTRGDILYLGYNDTSFGDEINANELPSSGIYLGSNNAPNIVNGSKVLSRGVHTGDLFITKTPSKVGGAGWISNTDYSNQIANGSYLKIPVVQSGATADLPTRGLVVGDMYFDTTINMPKWCTSIGRQQIETLTISTAPTSDGNITLTFNGSNYDIPVTVGMTKTELYQAIKSVNIEGLIVEEYSSSVALTNKDYKGGFGGSMFTINVGNTGAVINNSILKTGSNPQWKSLAEFINS